jgi:hypothetical protein
MSAHVLRFDDEATILDGLFWIFHASHEEWTMAFVSSVDEGRISIRLSLTRFFARSGRFAACSACCPVMWTRRRGEGMP